MYNIIAPATPMSAPSIVPSTMFPYEIYPTIIPAKKKPNKNIGYPSTVPTPKNDNMTIIIIANMNPSNIAPILTSFYPPLTFIFFLLDPINISYSTLLHLIENYI